MSKHDRYAKEYKKWHWGDGHAVELEWKDDRLPPILIECGRLTELHFRPLSRANPKRKDKILRLNKREANKSHVVYDPDHKHQRLYLLVAPEVRKQLKKEYRNLSEDSLSLKELALLSEGKHATNDYPDVDVKPLGILTHIVYTTTKIPDGLSHYIHEMGEESGIQPILALSKEGEPFIAGGDYTVPVPGITN